MLNRTENFNTGFMVASSPASGTTGGSGPAWEGDTKRGSLGHDASNSCYSVDAEETPGILLQPKGLSLAVGSTADMHEHKLQHRSDERAMKKDRREDNVNGCSAWSGVHGSRADVSSQYCPSRVDVEANPSDGSPKLTACKQEGEFVLSEVTAAMRKAIENAGDKRYRRDHHFPSRALELGGDQHTPLSSLAEGFPSVAQPAVDAKISSNILLKRMWANDIARESTDKAQKRPALLGDDQEDSVAGRVNLRRSPIIAKTRHQDFVKAVQDALRQVDVPHAIATEQSQVLKTAAKLPYSSNVQESARKSPLSTANPAHGELVPYTTFVVGGGTADVYTTDALDTEKGSVRDGDTVHATPIVPPRTIGHMHSSDPSAEVITADANEGPWVTYESPEGYPYLYNHATGESKWVASEEENDSRMHLELPSVIGTAQADDVIEEKSIRTKEEDNTAVGALSGMSDASSRGATERVSAGIMSSCLDTSGPDERNSVGETALHMAASQRSVRGLCFLLSGGANVNATDSRGRTPLHAAFKSTEGQNADLIHIQTKECVECLLASGALEDARDDRGQTPLHLASHAGMLGVAEALVAAGAAGVADDQGNTPLHLAAAQGHVDIMRLLITGNRGSDLDSWLSQRAQDDERGLGGDLGSDLSLGVPFTPQTLTGTPTETLTAPREHRRTGGRSTASDLDERQRPRKECYAVTRSDKGFWTKFETEDGYPYYHNDTTGVSSWKLPATLGITSDDGKTQDTVVGAKNQTALTKYGGTTTTRDMDSSHTKYGISFRDNMRQNGRLDAHAGRSGMLTPRRGHTPAEPRLYETSLMAEKSQTASASGLRDREPVGRRRECADRYSRDELPDMHPLSDSDEGRHRENYDQIGDSKLEVGNLFFENANTSASDGTSAVVHDWGSTSRAESNVGRETAGNRHGGRFGGRSNFDKGEKRQHHRSPRRLSKGETGSITWPEPLLPEEYDEMVGSILTVANAEGSRFPPPAVVSQALFAACVASRPNDAAALLHILENLRIGDANVVDTEGRTPLHHVCRRGDEVIVQLLCQAGGDPGSRDREGNTPLIVAAAAGSTACLRTLLRGGVDPNTSNDAGDTALHVAVWHGNLGCVKVLVENNGRLTQRNRAGFTPKEGVLKAGPLFSRGRLPRALRHTLEYVQRIEETLSGRLRPRSWALEDRLNSSTGPTVSRPRKKQHDPPLVGQEKKTGADHYHLDFGQQTWAEVSLSQSGEHRYVGTERDLASNRVSLLGGCRASSPEMRRPYRSERVETDQTRRQIRRSKGRGTICSEKSESRLPRVSSSGSMRRWPGEQGAQSSPDRSGFQHDNDILQSARGVQTTSNHSKCSERHQQTVERGRHPPRRTNSFSFGTRLDDGSRNEVQWSGTIGPHADQTEERIYNRGRQDIDAIRDRDIVLDEGSASPVMDSSEPAVQINTKPRSDSTVTGTGIDNRTGAGVWGALGRAVGSLLRPTAFASGEGAKGLEVSRTLTRHGSPGSAGDRTSVVGIDPSNRRPPTDDELRAMMPTHKALNASQHTTVSRQSQEFEHGIADIAPNRVKVDGKGRSAVTYCDDDGDVKVPLTLRPMQPPPDVLAAMGQQRRRSLSPPPDVKAALERARASRRNNEENGDCGTFGAVRCANAWVNGGADDIADANRSSASSRFSPHTDEARRAAETHPALGPFSLKEAGRLDIGGGSRPSSMYTDFLKENQRVHRNTGGRATAGARRDVEQR